MPPPNHHRIQRQVIELGLPAGVAAPQAQAALAGEIRERVTPELAAVFDAAASTHELLRLDRLEIDLGALTAADWLPRFRQRLIEELERQISRFKPERAEAQDARDGGADGDAMRLLLHFLVHGRLPWWGRRPDGGVRALFAEGGSTLDCRALRQCLQSVRRARIRLIESLDDAQLEGCVARWCGLANTADALSALASAAAIRASGRWRRRAWLSVIDWVLDDGFHAGREQDLIHTLRQTARELAAAQVGVEDSPAASPSRSWEDEARIFARLASPWREWLARPAERGGKTSVRFEPVGPAKSDVGANAPNAAERRPARPAPQRAEEIYLPGAGVILLHPFLEALFRERGLLVGRTFREEAARQRAVRLVGLLAFGVAEVPEYDLPIAKLLCGHPLDEPIEADLPGEEDTAACDALLDAVLGHWQALRSGSRAWLRAQFFRRDGKLESVDSGFLLTVERHAQDVLLARLPWGLGVIGMPWMKDRVFVHWLD